MLVPAVPRCAESRRQPSGLGRRIAAVIPICWVCGAQVWRRRDDVRVVPWSDEVGIVRALLGGDQLTRLRRGCFAVALLFCIAQIPNVMTLERPLGQRGVGLVALLVISLIYTIAYRRGTVSPAMRVSVIGAIVVATPILGSAVMGAAVTGAWMLALYPSRSMAIQGAALGLAAAVGGSIGINGAHEPASAVGAAITVPVMMLVLGQLRASLDGAR